MTEPAVLLDHVVKRYGAETVVSGVSATIPPGEFFTLLGPSGSGKTTTLSMIAGFTIPDGGAVKLGGRDVTHAAPRDRGLGMVFQNYAIFPHLDVFENVAFPLRVKRTPRAEVGPRVERALEMVKLGSFGKRYGRQLSGGQQQRVALARAIVAEPKVVLMDEPLGALDRNLRYQMQLEIKEIQKRLGMTVVFVTHDQEEALTMSDRIAIMNHGKIEQMGPPREVYEKPETAFVARFLGEANLLSVKAEGNGVVSKGGTALLGGAGQLSNGVGHLFVRPEKLKLNGHEPVGEGVNAVSGRVRHASFLGNTVRYVVETDEEDPILVDAANAPGLVLHAPGEAVQITWRPEDGRLLPE